MTGPSDRQRRLLDAVVSDDGFACLRAAVQQLRDEGEAKDVLLADLEAILAQVGDDVEDRVLDVMDLLVGWCAPSARID